MDTARAIKTVTAIATLATEAALVYGFVWSLVTGQKAILPIVFGMLIVGFGFFLRYDYHYFFGKKQ